jgi:hypothetical protein
MGCYNGAGCRRSGELCLAKGHLLDLRTRGNRAGEEGVNGAPALGKNRGCRGDLPARKRSRQRGQRTIGHGLYIGVLGEVVGTVVWRPGARDALSAVVAARRGQWPGRCGAVEAARSRRAGQ